MNAIKYTFIVLGMFEVISNSYHFTKKTAKNIGKSAKRQHQELPMDISDYHFFIKAIIMFIFGLIFLISGTLAIINLKYSTNIIWISAICFGLYGIIQAIIYRTEIKTWSSMIVYNIPLILLLLLK